VDLNVLGRGPQIGVGAERLGQAGGRLEFGTAVRGQPGHVLCGGRRRLDLDQNARALVLDRLLGANRAAELGPLEGVVDGHVEATAGASGRLGGEGDAGEVEGALEPGHGRAGASDQPGRHLVEGEPGRTPSQVHYRQVGAAESRRVRVDREQARSLRRLGHDQDEVGSGPFDDRRLGPGQRPCSGPERRNGGTAPGPARSGFGEGEGAEALAAGQPRQQVVLRLRVGTGQQRVRRQTDRGEQRRTGQGPAEFLEHHLELTRAVGRPAELLRDAQRGQAELFDHHRPQLDVKPVGAGHHGPHRRERTALVEEPAERLAQFGKGIGLCHANPPLSARSGAAPNRCPR
jgi:hypothetical protein